MQQELLQIEEEELGENPIAMCGGNLETVVEVQSKYEKEITYHVGSMKLIENAD